MKTNINRLFNRSFILFIPVFFLMTGSGCMQQAQEEEWIQLFNGEDLSGWDMKFSGQDLNENYKNTFHVDDGILKVSYDEYDRFNGEFGHLITEKSYSHYKLRVEYRIVGKQCPEGPGWAEKNNGIMIHSQSAENMTRDQNFPVSLEVQLLSGLGEGARPTANLCTPGTNVNINGELVTRHCNPSSSKTYGDEWVTVEVVVKGDEVIHHIVEGDTVLTYSKPVVGGGSVPQDYPVQEGTPVKSGHIAIQAESHPTEFRTIELLELGED